MHAVRRAARRAAPTAVQIARPYRFPRHQFSTSTNVNPRWLADLRARLQSQPSQHSAKLLAYLDQHWLELSAGREGYLAGDEWKGLNKLPVHWGDMLTTGHVNNIMYNRYAESSRVNWIQRLAASASGDRRQQWVDLMTPKSLGLIMRSIKTDYKLPVTYPDRVTVIHKLAERPAYTSDSLILEAIIFSEAHKRPAARCYEDIAIYDYQARKRATLHGYMVDALQGVYDSQKEARVTAESAVDDIIAQIQAIEA